MFLPLNELIFLLIEANCLPDRRTGQLFELRSGLKLAAVFGFHEICAIEPRVLLPPKPINEKCDETDPRL
jgi:hypothetical protein